MPHKIVYFVAEDWYFCSHRLELAQAAKAAGYEVVVVTRVRDHGEQIVSAGFKLIPLEISRRSLNPVKELKTIFRLAAVYRSERPSLVHNVALKPVCYGTIAARLAAIPGIINAVAGLGFLFSSSSFKARFLRKLVTLALRILFRRRGVQVILQNPDDLLLLCENDVVAVRNVTLIRGSGVDPQRFKPVEKVPGKPVVMLASRLLWDKGVGEFVEAAKLLLLKGVDARFVIVGEGDCENPSSIPAGQLEAWVKEGYIEWWGKKSYMPDVYARADIVCLPSYYGEGVPKALIEAASCECPIVTTDTPGCREIVRHGENGYLVPVRDSAAVACRLRALIESEELREGMGKVGRKLVKREFSLEQVIGETLRVYGGLYGH